MTEPRFFKKDNNERGAAEFKRCLPLGVQTSYTTMAPAIATAELLRMKPMLGEPLFEAAADYYKANGTSGDSEVLNALVELLQMTVVRLACWDSFAELAVLMTDAGISDNQGEKRAYRYQTDALRDTLRRQGYEYMNKVLEYCTRHADGDLVLFRQSQYYTERKASLIRSMGEFERFVSIGGDFTVFARLREWIESTEAMELEFRIGSSLKAALVADREAERFAAIKRGVMGFVAHWSMSEAAPFLNLLHTATGIVVVSEESGSSAASGKAQRTPTLDQVAAYATMHRKAAENYIGQVVTYCRRNSDRFPEIAEIGGDGQAEHESGIINNHGHKTFLVD